MLLLLPLTPEEEKLLSLATKAFAGSATESERAELRSLLGLKPALRREFKQMLAEARTEANERFFELALKSMFCGLQSEERKEFEGFWYSGAANRARYELLRNSIERALRSPPDPESDSDELPQPLLSRLIAESRERAKASTDNPKQA